MSQPKTVQKYLGHATLQMTMDLYTSVMPKRMKLISWIMNWKNSQSQEKRLLIQDTSKKRRTALLHFLVIRWLCNYDMDSVSDIAFTIYHNYSKIIS